MVSIKAVAMAIRDKSGNVKLDVAEISRRCLDLGWTHEKLAHKAEVSTGTINNVLSKGLAASLRTAHGIRQALGVESLESLLESDATDAADVSASDVMTVHEYRVTDVMTEWIEASNGLRFQICRMRHLELDDLARGKRYDLSRLSTEEEQRCVTWMKRHPKVCRAVKYHPNVITNETVFRDPREPYYWVIDEWVEGEPLSSRLRSDTFSRRQSQQLLLGIAEGLAAIHTLGVIRRELTPASILIRSGDGSAVLTEFELSKLVDHGLTVAPDEWPADEYRAPEADSDDVDHRADIYSWARVALHILSGDLPSRTKHAATMRKLKLPPSLAEVLKTSLSASRRSRPGDFQPVIAALRKWKVR